MEKKSIQIWQREVGKAERHSEAGDHLNFIE
jgi:hypothetical protein